MLKVVESRGKCAGSFCCWILNSGINKVGLHENGQPIKSQLGTKVMTKAAILVLACLLSCLAVTAGPASAQDVKSYTRDNLIQWMQRYANAKPDFKPGDVLTAKDLERIRPFIPPGYIEMLNFPEFKARIVAPIDRTPQKPYTECSEKYQSQVRLNPDGSVANYVCGEPFADGALDVNDPASGIKTAWNFNYRWNVYGLAAYNVAWIWVRAGGTPVAPHLDSPPDAWTLLTPAAGEKLPTDWSADYGGTGTFQRTLQSNYRRVYFSHLSQLPTHVLPVPSADDFEFKEIVEFFEPFDIDGTAFITFRYNQETSPYRADDAWAYVPSIRRVRRASAEERSDSLLGTDHTLDDFAGFAGRPLSWKWKLLGYKDVLTDEASRRLYARLGGPFGSIPQDDDWSLRRIAIVERTPKDPRHPYSSAVMFLDGQTHMVSHLFAFDRKSRLWKVWLWVFKWSETFTKDWSEYNLGTRCGVEQFLTAADIQNSRATIIPLYGAGHPNVSANEVQDIYDINNLERAHR